MAQAHVLITRRNGLDNCRLEPLASLQADELKSPALEVSFVHQALSLAMTALPRCYFRTEVPYYDVELCGPRAQSRVLTT